MERKLAAGVLALAMISSLPVQAHDIYTDLIDPDGGSCCNRTDCRPAHYRIVESGIRMHVYGLWVDVPEDKVQFRALPGDTGETAGGHWCGSGHHPGYGPEYYITHCAILPPNSVSTHGVFAD